MSEPQPTTCFTSAALSVQTTDQENTLPPPWLAGAFARSAPAPVVLLPAPPAKVASGGICALFWKDIPSSRLRREWSGRLRTQRVEVEGLASNHKPAPVLLDRHRRAHRRLSWAQCYKRNQSLGAQVHWSVQLHGVPAGISTYLKSLEQGVLASAA